MSTYLEAICTHEDMQSILPSLGEYNRNTVLTLWAIHSGSVYKSPSSGRVDILYRDGNELTSVSDLASVNSDGEYFYDSAADGVYLFSNANPQTNHTIEAGKDFTDSVNECRNRASEIVRSIVAKPIYKKVGVGYQGETDRNYDEFLIFDIFSITFKNVLAGILLVGPEPPIPKRIFISFLSILVFLFIRRPFTDTFFVEADVTPRVRLAISIIIYLLFNTLQL